MRVIKDGDFFKVQIYVRDAKPVRKSFGPGDAGLAAATAAAAVGYDVLYGADGAGLDGQALSDAVLAAVAACPVPDRAARPRRPRARNWSLTETAALNAAADEQSSSRWAAVAACLPGRTAEQCRNKYHNDKAKAKAAAKAAAAAAAPTSPTQPHA